MMLLVLLLISPLAGLLCLASGSRTGWERLNLGAFAAVAGLSVKIAGMVATQGSVTGLNGFLRADALSALVLVVTAFVALVSALYGVGFLRREEETGRVNRAQVRRFYVLTPLFVGAMLLVPLADNLGVMWVGIESATLASVLLVTFYNHKTSFEAGWKYIIIGSVGISLALFGTVFTYYAAVEALGAESHNGLNWSVLQGVAERLDPQGMRLGFVLAVVGYGTKAGLAPMHTWKPDAYAEAPIPTATLLAAGFLNCAIYAIMRFDALATKCLGPEFTGGLLIAFGLASVLVAAPFVLAQRNFRRLLAYSSIDHAGIMVAGLGFGGKLGALGAALHLLFHAAAKPLLFFCAGEVQQRFQTPYLRKVRGVLRVSLPVGALCLLATLAVTGTPPLSLFQSEFLILSAGLQAERLLPAALLTTGVVTIFAGFLRHMTRMNLGTPPEGIARAATCPWKTGAMLLVAGVILILGFWLPAPLFELVRRSAQIVSQTP